MGLGKLTFTARLRRSGGKRDELIVDSFRREQKREYSRAALREPIHAMCNLLEYGIPFEGEIVNISAGGLGFITNEPLNPDSVCSVSFILPLDKKETMPLKLFIRVIRQNTLMDTGASWYTACRFVLKDEKNPNAIRAFGADRRLITNFVDQYNIRIARMRRRK